MKHSKKSYNKAIAVLALLLLTFGLTSCTNSNQSNMDDFNMDELTTVRTITEADLLKVNAGMTSTEVKELLGETLDVGSATMTLRYQLEDGRQIDINFQEDGIDYKTEKSGEELLK